MDPQNKYFHDINILSITWKLELSLLTMVMFGHLIADFKVGKHPQIIESHRQEFMRNSR